MAESRRVHGLAGLQRAFDEVRFGATRTLNLRESLPTGAEAARRLDAWLRQHQVQESAELLVITGRGNNSETGIAVVREAAIRVFHELQRKGVVEGFAEHTPGSFVVTVAPISAMVEGTKRRPEPDAAPAPAATPTLAALGAETRQALRVLAERSLDALGVRERGPFVESEMLRLFGVLAPSVGSAAERESQLRMAIERAMAELD
ncbi:MAG: hypothetical protein JF589_15350 [Gemmatimonadetes bacterium]|jgi:hypothetical protein|nr:hypothetical protein [Gemmatimonadota bacterium]